MKYTFQQPSDNCIELRGPLVHWRQVARWVVTLGVAALLALHTAGCWKDISEMEGHGALRIMGSGIVIFVPGVLFLLVVMAVGWFLFSYWQSFLWDASDGTLVATSPGFFIPLHVSTYIWLADVGFVRIKIDRTAGRVPTPIEFSVRYGRDQPKKKWMYFTIAVREIDREEETIDLLLRIAHICGLSDYAVEGSSARRLTVAAFDEEEAQRQEDAQPIPEEAKRPRRESDYADQSIDLQDSVSLDIDVPPFDAGKLKSAYHRLRLIECAPGRRIHFRDAGLSSSDYAARALTGAAAGGMFGAMFLRQLDMSIAWSILPSIGFAVLLVGFAYLCGGGQREIDLNWQTGLLRWRVRRRWRSDQLNSIKRVAVHGQYVRRRSGKASGAEHIHEYYNGRVDLRLRDQSVALLRTEGHKQTMTTVYHELVPIAAELANALDRPWDWSESKNLLH